MAFNKFTAALLASFMTAAHAAPSALITDATMSEKTGERLETLTDLFSSDKTTPANFNPGVYFTTSFSPFRIEEQKNAGTTYGALTQASGDIVFSTRAMADSPQYQEIDKAYVTTAVYLTPDSKMPGKYAVTADLRPATRDEVIKSSKALAALYIKSLMQIAPVFNRDVLERYYLAKRGEMSEQEAAEIKAELKNPFPAVPFNVIQEGFVAPVVVINPLDSKTIHIFPHARDIGMGFQITQDQLNKIADVCQLRARPLLLSDMTFSGEGDNGAKMTATAYTTDIFNALLAVREVSAGGYSFVQVFEKQNSDAAANNSYTTYKIADLRPGGEVYEIGRCEERVLGKPMQLAPNFVSTPSPFRN